MEHGASPPGGQSQRNPSRSGSALSYPRRFEESWVEVASQPSSSSLSSVADEIVTTGLRVGDSQFRPRRRLQTTVRSLPQQSSTTIRTTTTTSSQEEYDESESDDDRLLASSTDNSHASPQPAGDSSDVDSDSDGDDATALGRAPDRAVFQPQPNVFSHPPNSRPQRSHSSASGMPPHPHSGFTRPSFTRRSQTTRVHRGGPSFMAPSVHEDNDAALRASLTTLLSCAAAARGLPKSKEEAEAWRASRNGVGPSSQPVDLRFMPESELMRVEDGPPQPRSSTAAHKHNSPAPSPTRTDATDKSGRPVSAARNPRAIKKKRALAAEDAVVSPTLLTWVVSAGVVVLVSVVGFGAGYVIGREVGRQEAQDAFSASMSAANDTSHTGREVMRSSAGLHRLRWGAGAVSRSIVAQA